MSIICSGTYRRIYKIIQELYNFIQILYTAVQGYFSESQESWIIGNNLPRCSKGSSEEEVKPLGNLFMFGSMYMQTMQVT